MGDLDLRRLRYFLAVADELNCGRAADRLHIAQPVLSRQISVLERELGVVLFARSKRGTELTEAGLLLREDACAILQSAALQRRARVAGRTGQHFTVGFMPGIIVTPAVRLLEEEFPGLRVDVVRRFDCRPLRSAPPAGRLPPSNSTTRRSPTSDDRNARRQREQPCWPREDGIR